MSGGRCPREATSLFLFFEHGDLALILRTALAAGGADYS